MKYTAFHADQFRRDVDLALKSVQQILDTTRIPRYAQDITEHSYDDKYALAESLVNTAISAHMNVLERMGLTKEKLKQFQELVQVDRRTVTLCLDSHDTCHFLKEQTVVSPSSGGERVIETSTQSTGFFGGTAARKDEVKLSVRTVVKEYHWKVGFNYRIYAYVGNEPTNKPIELQSRSSSSVIITKGVKEAPFPERTNHPPIATLLTWILQRISMDKLGCTFKINRSKNTCKTPVHNECTKAAMSFFHDMSKWSHKCSRHFIDRIDYQIMGRHVPSTTGVPQAKQDLQSIRSTSIFCPILPLMEIPRERAGTAVSLENPKSMLVLNSHGLNDSTSPLLSVGDIDSLLNEQIRTLDEQLLLLQSSYPSHQLVKIVTVAEASLVVLWLHTSDLLRYLENGIGYIEDMLKNQLIAAIGKEVHQKEFDLFMSFHNQRFFANKYAPKPFCYAIRRPDHYPDGILAIERTSDSRDTLEPVETFVQMISGKSALSMFIPINAATSIEITGPRFLHGWIQHRFASSPNPPQFSLTARARQFSSFMLMIGVMAGSNKFNPKEAIILQNKDELLIPLILNDLPTAKEFKDAIASLSPEQRRFAIAFRDMQLESSLFGVCVVQLKPQLEVLLGLPEEALTKEIGLTQDLMALFVDYQIPSDLLSFDGDEGATLADKVAVVKKYVKGVMDVIVDAKAKQLEEANQKAKMNVQRIVANVKQPLGSYGSSDSFGTGSPAGRDFDSPVLRMACMSAPSHPRDAPTPTQPMQRKQRSMNASEGPRSQQSLRKEDPNVFQSLQILEDSSNAIVQPPATDVPSKASGALDFTMIPKQLDAKFDEYDNENSIRSTIIEAGKAWTRKRQENLLTKICETSLSFDDTKSEQKKAFDLLDALSRSGTLPIACAELHVVVAVTHCFENDVMGTVIQDNLNPIEKVEKSSLLVASTIYGSNTAELINTQSDSTRLSISFPELFVSE